MPKATIGRIVIVHGIRSNGSSEHPAVITRAWSALDTALGPVAVNLTVFLDGVPPVTRSSVMLFDDEEGTRVHRAVTPDAVVAHWPARG